MPKLPALEVKTNTNHSPHVVILGAGASLAALPNGDYYGRKLPLMNNLVETVGFKNIIAKYGIKYKEENFEHFYDKLVSSGRYPELTKNIESIIEDYFVSLRLPEQVTLYDYLILSQRRKDIIATFNWDPLLAQAYRRNLEIVGFDNMPQIVFLHGNTAIGVCYQCKRNGWRYNKCDICKETFSASQLLYPISHKNYPNDHFLHSQCQELQAYIQDAYLITIFGYSAPQTDIEARNLMLEVWKKNEVTDFALFCLIDIKSKKEIKKNWKDFIVRDNYMISKNFHDSYIAIHPRRSCEAYAMATLQQSPWKENRFPKDIQFNWIT